MTDWLSLLRQAVEAAGSKAAVAREMGCSRTAVSLLLAGKYKGSTALMAARVLERYGQAQCPHLGRPVTPAECERHSGQVPTSSPAALRLWRACQVCPHKPGAANGREDEVGPRAGTSGA